MYKKSLVFLSLWLSCSLLFGQGRPLPINTDSLKKIYFLRDTVVDTAKLQSTVPIDTLTPSVLRRLDSISKVAITDSLKKNFGLEKVDLFNLFIGGSPHHEQEVVLKGTPLPRGDVWILIFLAILLLLFAALKYTFSKQLATIIESFFSNRVLGNLNKEENLFTSWPFLLLFVQFGFTIGMFFYLVARFKDVGYEGDGIQFFITVSIGIIALYIFKIVLLRVLGFVFDVQKPVNEYVSILYLSYFNTSLLFIPLVVAFALSPLKYGSIYIAIALVLVTIIFVFQFVRAGVNILSNYRFSKVYLILYFCTLEICPILILIKAIGF